MGSLYRSESARDQVVAWCLDRLPGLEVERVPTSLGETAVVTTGAGPRTVVYLPGTNFNAATSLTVLRALAGSGSTVACADLPGQPGLSAGARPSSDEAYADWVRELLEHLRRRTTGPLVLVGHSRGAAVALEAPPDLVDALVLVSPAGLVEVRPTWPMLRATVPWLLRRNDAGSARLAALMAGPDLPVPEGLVPWLTLVARTARTTGAPGPASDAVLEGWRGRPVAVLVGEHDCFFPPSRIVEAAGRTMGVEARVVGSAGHLLVDQAPDVVVDAVARV